MSPRRQIPRHEVVRTLHGEDVALIAVGALLGLLLALSLAGQVTALLAAGVWPSWQTLPILKVLWPAGGALFHPGDPMAGWPGLPPGPAPAAGLYWTVTVVLVTALAAGPVYLARTRLGGRSRPGFAAARQVHRSMGTQALLKQAPRLRPDLFPELTAGARVSATVIRERVRPDQVGVSLGTDVNTGIDCWSSVRQSKFVMGPSESGKTACVVIGETVDHDGPVMVSSSRADVMAATWSHRADRGRVVLFDPLRQASALPLVYWDLVAACADPPTAMRRAQSLVSGVDMSNVSGGGDVWKSRGEAILRNLLHAAAISHADIRTVMRWAYDQTSVEPAAILDSSPVTPPGWAEQQFGAISIPDRQRAGYYLAVESALAPFDHPAVLDSCLPLRGRTMFDPRTFHEVGRDGQQTLYLLAQKSQAAAVAQLLVTLQDEILDATRTAAQRAKNNRLAPAVRFVADEATNTGGMSQLVELISDGGGRGIPTTVVVQDKSQANDTWGREKAASMWAAATVRLVLPGVSGLEELREIAAYAGDWDEEIASLNRGSGARSEQLSLRTRPGMSPADVRAIESCHALVIAAGGLRPVETEMLPYYRRRDAATFAAAEDKFFAALNTGETVL